MKEGSLTKPYLQPELTFMRHFCLRLLPLLIISQAFHVKRGTRIPSFGTEKHFLKKISGGAATPKGGRVESSSEARHGAV